MFGKYGEFLAYFILPQIFMRFIFLSLFLLFIIPAGFSQETASLELVKTISGKITPKSIVHDGNGHFYAQNMMYAHNITVYDRNFKLVKTISDRIDLSEFGFAETDTSVSGSPVEATPSHQGKYLWVTNYQMFGDGFDNPGNDKCRMSKEYDSSFVYKINTQTLKIEAVAQVGCVPKYIAATPDNKYVLVTNWCSGDLSVIDAGLCKEIKRVDMGAYPRGIAVDSKSEYAYIAIMGGQKIIKLHLTDFTKTTLAGVGKNPRHLCIDSKDAFLYATLNGENKVVKIALDSFAVTDSAFTQTTPRSMTISADNHLLYITNYASNSLSVINTDSMKAVQTISTGYRPIGVTYDAATGNVWVACYSGSIQVFKNTSEKKDARTAAPREQVSASKGNYSYHIVVGAFKEDQNLEKMISKCSKAGYKPYVLNPDDKLKKVSCAAFESKASALIALEKIKAKFGDGVWLCKQSIAQ